MDNQTKEAKGMAYKDMQLVRQGDKIILPTYMSIDEGITWLGRIREAENKEIRVSHVFPGFPLDGAAALARAIAAKYGFADMRPTPGFFGDTPPQMVHVPVSHDKTVQVPWGRFAIPDVRGWLAGQVVPGKGNMPQFALIGQVKAGDKGKVAELAEIIATELRERSIYRGKAVRFTFPESNDPDDFDPTIAPEFMDLTGVVKSDLVYRRDVERLIETSIFTPIRHTAAVRAAGIPLKRGILLEGPYGTGKTLAATVTAKECEENGWSFLYAQVHQLAQAIEFAKLYGPAVIFAEDLDQILGTTDRDRRVNEVLNTIDGISTKNAEVMVVLTTNHVERIGKAMLRPGRLDTVITVLPPDAEAVDRLIRLYGRGLVQPGTDLTEAAKVLNGQIPAVIREVVERSKLAAVGRARDTGEPMLLTGQDLLVAAEGMVRHLGLLKELEPDTRSDAEKAADRIATGIVTAFALASDRVETVAEAADEARTALRVPSGQLALTGPTEG